MNYLSIFLFFIFTNNYILSMDPPKSHLKNRSLTDPDIHSPFAKSLSPTDLNNPPTRGRTLRKKIRDLSASVSPKDQSPRDNTNDYINLKYSIQKGSFDSIKIFLANPKNNPNLQDENTKLTLLHQAVIHISMWHKEIMDLFLQDPRIKSEIIDNHGRIALQYITGNDIYTYKDLYDQLILRNTLDLIIRSMMIIYPSIMIGNKEYIRKKTTALLSKISTSIIPSYATGEFICNMLQFRIQHDRITIEDIQKQYMKNPNYQDEYGNTYLHHAVNIRNKKLVAALITHANIDCMRNKDNLYPQSLLLPVEKLNKDIKEMSEMLFMRDSIERWTAVAAEEQSLVQPIKNHYTLTPTHPLIKDTINAIKGMCAVNTQKQYTENGTDEDGQLPNATATLPSYANDYFLYQRIIYQIGVSKGA